MSSKLEKNYNPKDFESRIYESWEKDGDFHAEVDSNKTPYTIVMPPPNITGQLHMGHALDESLQDALIRYKRLCGFSTLWLPGTDHASIATEVKVAEELSKTEGLTKEDLGRDEFQRRVWEWREKYGRQITNQQRRLGASCDWERERFTMDEGCNKAVVEFFIRLYEKDYIYRGNRLINWCPECGTSLSDAEVEHEDTDGKYWYINYPTENLSAGITVATSRPETMFADVAIAVAPEDDRYKDLIGTNVILPIVGKVIPIIADEYPDPEKGTGAVKITPAHDPNDFLVGQRHNLNSPVCIDFDAKMTDLAGEYEGLDRFECRKKWLMALEEGGYIVKVEDVIIPTGHCYRCDTVVEPMLSEQWFVAMEKLAQPAVKAAQNGELKHVPARFEKVYLNWLLEIKDWCISRQLWWGHRIPAYYCDKCGHIIVGRENPEYSDKLCPVCGNNSFRQDDDVLDTWFSSALWPFSTLGWPEDTADLRYFYPTNVLVTGYDIIFFWVVRMVFSALEMTGVIPFEHIFVHGLVRDDQGRKMSKSLGNGVDPLEIIDSYGADALRFMLLSGSASGSDIRYSDESVQSARNFANKLWNASRFVLLSFSEDGAVKATDEMVIKLAKNGKLAGEDIWVLSKLKTYAADITKNLDAFELGLASAKIYELTRDIFCDWYIELVKVRLYDGTEEEKATVLSILKYTLKDILRLLHPFMPFITEEIFGKLENDSKLIIDNWPNLDLPLPSAVTEGGGDLVASCASIELCMETIRSIRAIRVEYNTLPSKKLDVVISYSSDTAEVLTSLKSSEHHLIKLANLASINYKEGKASASKGDKLATRIVSGLELSIQLGDLVDEAAEKEKLGKERARLSAEIARIEGKLSNEGFMSKAPEPVIAAQRVKLEAYKLDLSKLQ